MIKLLILNLIFWIVTASNPINAQSINDSCYTVPQGDGLLIRLSKADGQETVVGPLGVKEVQAIAFSKNADTLFAAKAGRIGIIDINTGLFTSLEEDYGIGDGPLGPMNFVQVEGLTFDGTTNTLLGSAKIDGTDDLLFAINTQTGAHIKDAFGEGMDYVTISGPGVKPIIEDLAWDPITGQLFGLSRDTPGNDLLIVIDRSTGVSSVIGPLGENIIEGLGFDSNGELFATPGSRTTPPKRFYRIDTKTGLASEIAVLKVSKDYESCDCRTEAIVQNENPIAEDDSYSTRVNTTLTIDAPGVLSNDIDPDGDAITIISNDSTTSEGGIVELNEDGSFSFTPKENFMGSDTFTYVISDGKGGMDQATVTIEVNLTANTKPSAKDDLYHAELNVALNVPAPGLLSNDSDPDGDTLVIIKHDTTTVAGGMVTLESDGSFTYNPPEGFVGVDSFTYSITDGNNATDSATVTILIKDPNNTDPNATDDRFTTDVDSSLQIDAPGVLSNDTDPDGDDLVVIAFDSTSSKGGEVMINPDGELIYSPPGGFEGEDSFNYVVSDGRGGVDTAAVIVAVIKEATVPVANDDVYFTNKNTELIIDAPGVLSNDTDPNGDLLSVVSYDASGSNGGTVQLNTDGSFVFTPAQDSIVTDTFNYVITDGNGNTDTASVSINIIVISNSPPIAVDDTTSTDQDAKLMITDPNQGILVNDSDPDGDDIAAVEIMSGITDQGGSITIFEDGTYTYVPNLGFVGIDTYEYTVCDDQNPQLCDSALIYIEVKELEVKVFNAFSPNDDGRNDTWVIQGITRFPNNHVQIFNRWGNLIFEATGYDNTTKVWKGRSSEGIVFGNDGVPDGAYFYVISLGDGGERLSGYVVIRR